VRTNDSGRSITNILDIWAISKKLCGPNARLRFWVTYVDMTERNGAQRPNFSFRPIVGILKDYRYKLKSEKVKETQNEDEIWANLWKKSEISGYKTVWLSESGGVVVIRKCRV
jgi:hypothetical protein